MLLASTLSRGSESEGVSGEKEGMPPLGFPNVYEFP